MRNMNMYAKCQRSFCFKSLHTIPGRYMNTVGRITGSEKITFNVTAPRLISNHRQEIRSST